MGQQEKTEELLLEIEELKKKLADLEKLRAFSREDRLKLAVLDRVPFTMWACDKNFEIKLWTCNCEGIYLYRKEDVIGKNYLELFVSEPERYQSKIDCERIIDHDYVQRNFLAFDQSKMGIELQMLTNCFRIWDEDSKQFLQAEVALEVSDLELRRGEHRQLREIGITKSIQEKEMIELKKENLLLKLKEDFERGKKRIDSELIKLRDWEAELSREIGVQKAKDMTSGKYKIIESQEKMLSEKKREIEKRIIETRNLEDLKSVSIDLTERE